MHILSYFGASASSSVPISSSCGPTVQTLKIVLNLTHRGPVGRSFSVINYNLIFLNAYTIYVTGFGRRDLIAHFKKIELLLP